MQPGNIPGSSGERNHASGKLHLFFHHAIHRVLQALKEVINLGLAVSRSSRSIVSIADIFSRSLVACESRQNRKRQRRFRGHLSTRLSCSLLNRSTCAHIHIKSNKWSLAFITPWNNVYSMYKIAIVLSRTRARALIDNCFLRLHGESSGGARPSALRLEGGKISRRE
jgi:hypothetical protein